MITKLTLKYSQLKWWVLAGSIVTLALFGLFNIPLENLFFGMLNFFVELVLLFLVAVHFKTISKKAIVAGLIGITYFVGSYVYACIIRNTHLMDFLVAYKAILYIIFLTFLVDKAFIKREWILYFYQFLFTAFVVSYFSDIFLFTDKRPRLLGENNYEMMFFAIIIYLKYVVSKKFSPFEAIVCFLIFVLSESRSGVVIYMFVAFAIFIKEINLKTILMGSFLAIPAGLGLVFVFYSRLKGGSVEEIDRVRMLLRFVYEVRDWNLLNFLFGTEPVTRMSYFLCNAPEFTYSNGNRSYSGDDTCYSVVLHSYVLRSLFDHGLVGMSFIFFSIYSFLRRSLYTIKESLVFSGIIVLNSLSVSGYNSIFAIIGISIALLTKHESED